MRALLIVDAQPTFCDDGELPVAGGHDVIDRIADFLRMQARLRSHHLGDGPVYDLIVTSQDWHVDPGDHFSDTPDYTTSWPPHGRAGTEQAQIHSRLRQECQRLGDALPPIIHLYKGMYSAAYSAFEGETEDHHTLADICAEQGITHMDVVGLEFSNCVAASARDARRAGLITRVWSDLTQALTEEVRLSTTRLLESEGISVEHSPLLCVAVYMASRPGKNPHFMEESAAVGRALAEAGMSIVYGGGNCGLMGAVADSAIEAGGSVYGVIPHHFDEHEVSHYGITRLELVNTMAERKTRMTQLSDCSVALPGGVGTMEEFFEVLAHHSLSLHSKPVMLYNIDGFWDSLVQAMHSWVDAGVMTSAVMDNLIIVDTPQELIACLQKLLPASSDAK